ncbi:hypothetical protein MD484_g2413, partial [Candolleomyces efflorescens]
MDDDQEQPRKAGSSKKQNKPIVAARKLGAIVLSNMTFVPTSSTAQEFNQTLALGNILRNNISNREQPKCVQCTKSGAPCSTMGEDNRCFFCTELNQPCIQPASKIGNNPQNQASSSKAVNLPAHLLNDSHVLSKAPPFMDYLSYQPGTKQATMGPYPATDHSPNLMGFAAESTQQDRFDYPGGASQMGTRIGSDLQSYGLSGTGQLDTNSWTNADSLSPREERELIAQIGKRTGGDMGVPSYTIIPKHANPHEEDDSAMKGNESTPIPGASLFNSAYLFKSDWASANAKSGEINQSSKHSNTTHDEQLLDLLNNFTNKGGFMENAGITTNGGFMNDGGSRPETVG